MNQWFEELDTGLKVPKYLRYFYKIIKELKVDWYIKTVLKSKDNWKWMRSLLGHLKILFLFISTLLIKFRVDGSSNIIEFDKYFKIG